jgi:acyl carrier protein
MNIDANQMIEFMIELGIHIDKSTITPDQEFSDAGLDSLDRANLFLGIEEKYGITVAEEDVDSLDSINAVLKYINNNRH